MRTHYRALNCTEKSERFFTPQHSFYLVFGNYVIYLIEFSVFLKFILLKFIKRRQKMFKVVKTFQKYFFKLFDKYFGAFRFG